MIVRPNWRQSLHILRTHAEMFGFWPAVRQALVHVLTGRESPDDFDAKYGTDTSVWVQPSDANLPEEYTSDANPYGPTNLRTLRHVLRNLPIRYEDFEFFDLGSGKGRVVLAASDYAFAAVTGIELSPTLAGISSSNLEKYTRHAHRRQKCTTIRMLQANATSFEIPDSNIVFFMFHPFRGRVFEQCIEHIHRRAVTTTRETYLVYVNPWVNERRLKETGYFDRIGEWQVMNSTWCWSLWKHVGDRSRTAVVGGCFTGVRSCTGDRTT